VFDRCAIDVPTESMHARFMPDPPLGVTTVRLACNDAEQSHRLDEIAVWAVAACLVEELVLACRRTEHERRDG
jgi:hypothetical protein